MTSLDNEILETGRNSNVSTTDHENQLRYLQPSIQLTCRESQQNLLISDQYGQNFNDPASKYRSSINVQLPLIKSTSRNNDYRNYPANSDQTLYPIASPANVASTLSSNLHSSTGASALIGSLSSTGSLAGGPHPAHHLVDFGQAVSYVSKIKNHFIHQPEVYRAFLEILTDYQRYALPVEEVNAQVQTLFTDAPHLIDEFKQFLPVARGGGVAGMVAGQQSFTSKDSAAQVLSSSIIPNSTTPHGAPYQQTSNLNAGMPPMGGHFPDSNASQSTNLTLSTNNKRRTPQISNNLAATIEPTHSISTKKRKVDSNSNTNKRARRQITCTSNVTSVSTLSCGIPSGNHSHTIPNNYPSSGSNLTCIPNGEQDLFDKIKKRINSPGVYHEFLKVLHLYSQDILSQVAMVERVRGFLASRAPDLFAAFLDLVGYKDDPNLNGEIMTVPTNDMAPLRLRASTRHMDPAGQPLTEEFTGFSKYNHAAGMDTWQVVGPSYRRIRKGIQVGICSGRDALARSVLNDEYVSHPPTHSDANAEDQLNVHRRNPHEEHMSRVEEERYEFDVTIEANSSCIRALEPIAHKLAAMRDDERRNFRLPKGLGSTAPSVMARILKKLYGDHATQVSDALCSIPAIALPLVLKRLKQKDDEWRRQKRDLAKVWRESDSKNFYKSLDYQGAALKASEKKFHVRTLIQEIEAAYLEHRERRMLLQQPIGSSAGAIHHLDLPVIDRAVIKDVMQLVSGLGDANFTRMRSFLDAFFFHCDESSEANTEDAPTRPTARRKMGSSSTENKSSIVLFANNQLYVLIRLVHMLYSKLVGLKAREQELTQLESPKPNPVAVELGLQPPEPPVARDPSTFYSTVLKQINAFVKGQVDSSKFEDSVRAMFGTTAYVVFAVDKTTQALLKQCKDVAADSNSKRLVSLFTVHHKNSRNANSSSGQNWMAGSRYHLETQYRLAAEDLVAKTNTSNTDHVYRIEFLQSSSSNVDTTITVQLLSSQDFISDAEAQWSHYVEQYTTALHTDNSKSDIESALDDSKIRPPLLRRNLRKCLMNATFDTNSENNDVQRSMISGAFGRAGLQLKICVNTYRLFYIANTEDYYVRPASLTYEPTITTLQVGKLQDEWARGLDADAKAEMAEKCRQWMMDSVGPSTSAVPDGTSVGEISSDRFHSEADQSVASLNVDPISSHLTEEIAAEVSQPDAPLHDALMQKLQDAGETFASTSQSNDN